MLLRFARRGVGLALLMAVLPTTPAAAQTVSAPYKPTPLPAAPAAPASPSDINLLPSTQATPEEQAQAEAIEHAVKTRRHWLQLHQGIGIATAALMAATVVFGQLDYSDKFGGGNSGQFELAHDYLEAITTLSFVADGIIALAAPVPYAKKNEGIDTVTVHKYSMLVATLGFATEIVLGVVAVAREGHLNQQDFAEAHLVVGYTTAAAMATGVGALFF